MGTMEREWTHSGDFLGKDSNRSDDIQNDENDKGDGKTARRNRDRI